MDSIQHSAWGVAMTVAVESSFGLEHSIALNVSSAVMGAMPDLIGIVGLVVERSWRFRNWAHGEELETAPAWFRVLVKLMMLHPAYSTHIWMDSGMHAAGDRWWIWDEGLRFELLGWLGVFILLGKVIA